ncbi:MAG: hypothetical protein OEZ10_02270 [Gammaproteobacteria bacterium]|nr:hypothetical protein [Gammaproteobacteria bacterium]
MKIFMKPVAKAVTCMLVMTVVSACDENGNLDIDVPDVVDLRFQQTPLKNQGGKRTCITFSVVAAMEAAYKEAGYGDLNLAEDFVNHMGKTMWIHPNWGNPEDRDGDGVVSDLDGDGIPDESPATLGPNFTETQVAAFGGGTGLYYLGALRNWMRVPSETDMPYVSGNPDLTPYCATCGDWADPYWKNQRNASDYNLDPAILPRTAVTAGNYYSIGSFRKLATGNTPAEIEAALLMGHEVVWDFLVGGNRTGGVWVPDSSTALDGHSMLIVGYDRSDPANPFFIVKNSWGINGAGADGWTRISYNYLSTYGTSGGYIETVNVPTQWPELAFVGKWNLSFDGHHGELHVYHMPGASRALFDEYPRVAGVADKRIGTFYDAAGNAYRVNGVISGRSMTYYIDWANPNLRWDQLQGRRFEYQNFTYDDMTMAGLHYDGNATVWGGYARQSAFLASAYDSARPLAPESYLGSWRVNYNGELGTLVLDHRDDNLVSRAGSWAALGGTFVADAVTPVIVDARAEVSLADRKHVIISTGQQGANFLDGMHLSWEGVIAGNLGTAPGGFYAERIFAFNYPPFAAISAPLAGQGFAASLQDTSGWYASVNIAGTATDTEDGLLGNKNFTWTTSINGQAESVLAAFAGSLTAKLYAPNCGANTHDLRFYARDSGGMYHFDSVSVSVTRTCP